AAALGLLAPIAASCAGETVSSGPDAPEAGPADGRTPLDSSGPSLEAAPDTGAGVDSDVPDVADADPPEAPDDGGADAPSPGGSHDGGLPDAGAADASDAGNTNFARLAGSVATAGSEYGSTWSAANLNDGLREPSWYATADACTGASSPYTCGGAK